MECRHFNTDEIESQDDMEICTETQDLKTNLKMKREKDQLAFWTKLSKKLRDLVTSHETNDMGEKSTAE